VFIALKMYLTEKLEDAPFHVVLQAVSDIH